MEVETETETSSTVATDLIAALEQATLMAKQLPTTTHPSQLHQIHAALHHLSLFLSHHHPPPPPPENSVSSAVPMQMGDDEDEQNSRATTVDKVEGRLRECSIQNKRPKRQLSPSAAALAEQRRSYENVAVLGGGDLAAEFDPVGTKLRSLDLIYQFHA